MADKTTLGKQMIFPFVTMLTLGSASMATGDHFSHTKKKVWTTKAHIDTKIGPFYWLEHDKGRPGNRPRNKSNAEEEILLNRHRELE